jgi:hypothetical protein
VVVDCLLVEVTLLDFVVMVVVPALVVELEFVDLDETLDE